MLDDEITIQKNQAGQNDALNERRMHFKRMKINFHAWVRNKASVVDDMECDLTESSHKIRTTKQKTMVYVADKNVNAILRFF